MTTETFYKEFYRDLDETQQLVWDTADQFATEVIIESFGENPTLEDVKEVLNSYID